MLRCICTVGGVPNRPRKLLGCQSAKPKHLKGVLSDFEGGGGPKLLFMQKLIRGNVAVEHVDISEKVFNEGEDILMMTEKAYVKI